MALERGERITEDGMQSLVSYMMGENNPFYQGAAVRLLATSPLPVTSNYQRMNRVRFEVLGTRMHGYLNETGKDFVNLDLVLLDEADRGFKITYSASMPCDGLEKILSGK